MAMVWRGEPPGLLLVSLPIAGRLAGLSLAAKNVMIEAEAAIGRRKRERGLAMTRSLKLATRRHGPVVLWRQAGLLAAESRLHSVNCCGRLGIR